MCVKEKRDKFLVNGKSYTIIRVLGESRRGYLYQVMNGRDIYMLKDYKPMNDIDPKERITQEVKDYKLLKELGIPVPELIDYDANAGIMIKEYIAGFPASETLLRGEIIGSFLEQVKGMADKAEEKGCVLDYFPTNYLIKKNNLYYTNYLVLEKTEDNDFDSKGIRYWMNAVDFTMEYMKRKKEKTN